MRLMLLLSTLLASFDCNVVEAQVPCGCLHEVQEFRSGEGVITEQGVCGAPAYNITISKMVFQETVFPDNFTYQQPFCMSTIFKQPPLTQNIIPFSSILVEVRRSSDQRTIFGLCVGPEVEVEYYGTTLTVPIRTQTPNDNFVYLSVCIDLAGELSVFLDCQDTGFSETFPPPAFEFPSEPSSVVVGIGVVDEPFNGLLQTLCFYTSEAVVDNLIKTIEVEAAQQRLCEHRPCNCHNVGVSSLCQLTLPDSRGILESCMKEESPTSGTIDSGLSAGLFVSGLASGIAITLLVVGIIWGACKLPQKKSKDSEVIYMGTDHVEMVDSPAYESTNRIYDTVDKGNDI